MHRTEGRTKEGVERFPYTAENSWLGRGLSASPQPPWLPSHALEAPACFLSYCHQPLLLSKVLLLLLPWGTTPFHHSPLDLLEGEGSTWGHVKTRFPSFLLALSLDFCWGNKVCCYLQGWVNLNLDWSCPLRLCIYLLYLIVWQWLGSVVCLPGTEPQLEVFEDLENLIYL